MRTWRQVLVVVVGLVLGLALSQAPVQAAAALADKGAFKDQVDKEGKSAIALKLVADTTGLPKVKGKPSLAGETITLSIDSADLPPGTASSKGKVTTPFKASMDAKGHLSFSQVGAQLINLFTLSTEDTPSATVIVQLKVTADKVGQTQAVLFFKSTTFTYSVKKGKIAGKLTSEGEL